MSATVSITWWGHASTTIEMGGRRILTDPVLTRRIAHLSRIGGQVPHAAALRADVAVVSHLHLDHLHVPSLRMLSQNTRIVAPIGAARALRRALPELARRVEEVGTGDALDLDGVGLRAVPAVHDERRFPGSRHRGPALGFVFEQGGSARTPQVWFAGDTGLFAAMAEISPVDVAIVPVGGWGPTLGPTHLDPAQASEAVRRVHARDAVPIHYGTFWPTGLRHLHPAGFRRHFADAGIRFAHELVISCPRARAHVIAQGETVVISCAST